MKVTLSTVGKFHSFHLAQQLYKHDALEAIYTGYPKFKLKNSGVPAKNIKSFPLFRGSYMYFSQFLSQHPKIKRELGWWAHEYLDIYSSKTLPECDIFMALSGVGQYTGKVQKERGGVYICDRGSAHILYQEELLQEEHYLLDIPYQSIDQRIIDKELAEYEEANTITIPSNFAMESFIQKGISPTKLCEIPYGVNLSTFSEQNIANNNEFNIVFIGGTLVQKGLFYLIEAFNKITIKNKTLTIIGSVNYEINKLKKFTHLSYDNVVFTGNIDHDQLQEQLMIAHVLVQPSIQDGFGMVMAEAMACGCPVIATTNTGASDLFTDGKEGFIVPIRSSDAIAEKLQVLADNPDLQQNMSTAALKKVQSLGGWDTYGDNTMSLFNELLNK